MKTCFIITGLIEDKHINNLLETYKDYEHKILSTWENQDTSILEKNNFIVVKNKEPIIKHSINYQSATIQGGIIKAKELNYEYIIRIRTDIFCNDIKFLKDVFTSQNIEKISCIYNVKVNRYYFFLDLVISGKIDNIQKLFISCNNSNGCPEQYWLTKYFNINKIDINFLKENINTIRKILSKNKEFILKWNHPEHNIDLINGKSKCWEIVDN